MKGSSTRTIWIAALILASVLTSGCATSKWAVPIGKYQKSVDATATIVGGYYKTLNSYERDLYLDSVYLDPALSLAATDQQGKPTGLVKGVFATESIDARLDALELIGVYGSRLARLAGTDAPGNFATGASDLGKSLTGLSATFQNLAGSQGDSTAAAYVGPISTLVGVIGQSVLERRRDSALIDAIAQGDPQVTKIFDQIEADLGEVISAQRQSGEQQRLAELVAAYNGNRSKMTVDQRSQFMDRIRASSDAYRVAASDDSLDAVDAMRKAHRALVKYATSPRKPGDMAEVADALEVFAARVEAAAGAIRELKDRG